MTRENPKPQFVLLESDEPHLAKIPERMAEPLRLAHRGIGYAGIAADLQVPIGTVKSRINRARERILHMRSAAAETVNG